jgi:hypothetical protein
MELHKYEAALWNKAMYVVNNNQPEIQVCMLTSPKITELFLELRLLDLNLFFSEWKSMNTGLQGT